RLRALYHRMRRISRKDFSIRAAALRLPAYRGEGSGILDRKGNITRNGPVFCARLPELFYFSVSVVSPLYIRNISIYFVK
ncbi:MAG: hypothetical protein ACI3XZ_06965, partial [Butyricicoccus sp.]